MRIVDGDGTWVLEHAHSVRERDGMLSGINVDATLRLARELRIPVIASGGLTKLADVERLCELETEGITAVITGRAIYEGTLDFRKAQEMADKLLGAG